MENYFAKDKYAYDGYQNLFLHVIKYKTCKNYTLYIL